MQRGGQDLQMRELLDTIRELRLTIEALRKELNAKEKQMETMQEQLNYFQKKLFGTSSEKHSLAVEGQLGLFDEVESEAAKETAPEPDAEEEPAASPRPRRPRTRKEELLRGIPVTEKIVDLPEAEKICPKCGAELQPAGRKFLRDEIHFVPAKVTVTRIYAQTYSCPECRREAAKADSNAQNSLVTAAVPPALIPHSMATEQVVAHAMYQKYANAVPLYRQETDWAQYGLPLSRGRLARWIQICSEDYFLPVYAYLHRLLLQRKFLMADETRIQVLKEPQRAAERDSFLWVFRSGEDGLPPILLYGYTETRAGANAQAFLNGFQGYLMTDGYQGYNHLPGVVRTCCWAHVRRYFHDAIPQGKQMDYAHPAVQGVIYCDKLFAIEKYCREHAYTAEQRHAYRLKKAPPVLQAFWKWLESLQDADPKSRLGKAYTYAKNRRPYLETYLEDGRCSLSNNAAENAIRPFCVGRRNWLFSDSPAGAQASARVYTMVQMARAHNLNVERYLTFLLKSRPTMAMSDAELGRLLPWGQQAQSSCSSGFAQ